MMSNTSGRWLVTATSTPASRTLLHHSRTRSSLPLLHQASVPVSPAPPWWMAIHPVLAAISLAPRPGLMDSSSPAVLRVVHIIWPPSAWLYAGTRCPPSSMQLMPSSSARLKHWLIRSGVFHARISTSIMLDRCDKPATVFDPMIRRETSYLPKRTVGTLGCGSALARAARPDTAASVPTFCKKSRREFSPAGPGLNSEFIVVCLL